MCVGQFLAHEHGEYGDQSHLKISKSLGVSMDPVGRILNFGKHCIWSCQFSTSQSKVWLTEPCLSYKRLKLKLRVFLTGYAVAMETYYDLKIR